MKIIKLLFITVIVIYSCSSNNNSNNEIVCKEIISRINKVPQLNIVDCYVKNKKIVIQYEDSVDFTDYKVEEELAIYLVCDLQDSYDIKSIDYTIYYPNRSYLPSREMSVKKDRMIKALKYRYVDNPKYKEVVEKLFFEENSRYLIINILNYLYGYVSSDDPTFKEDYDKNIFDLLYKCLIEKKGGMYGKNNVLLEKIYNTSTSLPKRSDYVKEKVGILIDIIKNS